MLASRRLDIALALLDQNDIEAAIEVAQAALSADPDWQETHFVLGEMFERADQRENAIEAFRQCLALDPVDRMGAEIRLTLLGAVALRDRLPPDYVRALFDDYAPRFETSLRDGLVYRGPELLFEAVRSWLPELLRPLRVLDLGCGTGLVADVFAGHVDVIDGVDLSSRMINRARAKGMYRNLVAADITDLPDSLDDDYGLVLAGDVLNYLGDLGPALRAAHARLVPGGLMVFTLEHGDIFPFDLGPGQRFRHHEGAIYDWLKDCQFELLSDATGILRQEKGRPVSGRIMVVRAGEGIANLLGGHDRVSEPDHSIDQTVH